MRMNLLGLDLGSKTGVTFNDGAENFCCGTWTLATDKELAIARTKRMDRRCDPRVKSLYEKLVSLHRQHDFDAVVFEDVQFASYTLQVQLWSSLRAAVWLAFGSEIVECVPVSTLKKFATGHGGATKEQMGVCLCRSDARFRLDSQNRVKFNNEPVDDNAVDSAWLHRWAAQNLSRLK